MGSRLNRWGFEELVRQNKEWLLDHTSDTLERRHIIGIMEEYVDMEYIIMEIFAEYEGMDPLLKDLVDQRDSDLLTQANINKLQKVMERIKWLKETLHYKKRVYTPQ